MGRYGKIDTIVMNAIKDWLNWNDLGYRATWDVFPNGLMSTFDTVTYRGRVTPIFRTYHPQRIN